MAYQAVEEAFKLAREQNSLLRKVLLDRKTKPPVEANKAVLEAFRLVRQAKSQLIEPNND